MKINPLMLVLAREYRGLTQEDLARKLLVSQARIAKFEGGLQTDIPDPFFDKLCNELEFPHSFFQQEEDLVGFGSSAYYYRKKVDLTAADRKRIHGVVNLLRIHIKQMLSFVEIEGKRKLPQLDLEEYGGSPVKVAQAVRAFWLVPDGPINNLTNLIESAGVIVIPCDFRTRSMDATSLRLNELPPVIFISAHLLGDRWRFTLAHELGHLIMHSIPTESMEEEADEFAAELLMPEAELRPQFARLGDIRLQDLKNLKLYWKVSIAALLKHAYDLGFISDNRKRYMWSCMSKWGWRMQEPEPLPREEPKTYKKIVDYFTTELKYTLEDLTTFLKVNLHDLLELHAAVFPVEQNRAHLRVIS